MKLNKIFSGIMALLMGAAMLTACSDKDDYSANTGTLLTDGSVVTGSSDVTATTATFHGTVTGLENMNPASYSTGFKYGYAQNALTETATAASASEFSSSLSGLVNNTVIYYQAFVTLQGKLTYTGEVKSLITTDATATTGDATDIDFAGATLAGSISKYPEDAKAGIVISTTNDEETVRAGLRLANASLEDSYAIAKSGLLPSTTYYYAAYLDLGPGVVYGEVKQFTTASMSIDVEEDFVDLGLSVKWAKRNIGASTETGFGGLYAFGDLTGTNPSIDPADYASADTYRTALDLPNILYDRITLPTAADFEELFKVCTTEWTEMDGVVGYKVTAKNGNSIFLPASGKRVAHTITGEGEQGFYLTGTLNATNKEFAVDYEFNANTNTRSTRAVYEALAVRPVTIAKKFKKEYLYNTWHIDLRANGTSAFFPGPICYYDAVQTWAHVQDGDPKPSSCWDWCPAWSDISSWIGFTPRDFGTMTLTEDGKVTVTHIAADGTETTEEGTYTVDEINKTITLSIDILDIPEQSSRGTNKKTNLRFFSLSEETMQIAMLIDGDTGQLVFNYTTAKNYEGYAANLCLYDGDDSHWNNFSSVQVLEAGKQYTIEAQATRNAAMVYVLDFPQLAADYPNAVIRIDKIEVDGTEVAFDANKFHYGDLENKGTYRVELFNIWGTGTNNDSPFGGGAKDSESALAFSTSLKITYTVVTLDGFYAGLTTCDSNWNSSWPDTRIPISINGGFPQEYTISYDSSRPNGMIDLVELKEFYTAFPNAKLTLKSVTCDGTVVPFDASKILYGDLENKGHYRIELYNTYGGSAGNSAFGEVETNSSGTHNTQLGFNTNMTVVFTIDKLY